MPNFVWDNTALPTDKVNLVNVPTGANPVNYVQGTDINAIFTALKEIRNAIWKLGGKITPAAAPPVAGTFAVGDVVMNSAPAVGQPIGWVCVTAGAPGTWKEFGVIADDVLNGSGGGSEPQGPSDIETPQRLFGATNAILGLYPDDLVNPRRGAIGFLNSNDPVLTIQNEKTTGGNHIRLVPGTGGHADLSADARTNKITPLTGNLVEINAPKAKVTGVNTATVDLFPDGTTTRKGYVGFDTASEDVLHVKNEKSTGGHVRVEPGAGGSIQLGAAETTGFRALKVFTTTWNPDTTGHDSSDSAFFNVSGISVGDVIIGCSLSSITDVGVFVAAHVVSSGVVGVTMINESGGSVSYGSGTLKLVWLDLT